MTVPIFWRIIWGYSAILVLSIGLSLYSIFQLGQLSRIAQTALNVDNRMIADEEKLTDAMLSQVRYEKRFLIAQASTLYDQFHQFQKDFGRYLDELNALAESPDIKARLARVQEFHLRYHDLFDQEVQYLQARQPYAQTRYREEKEKMVDKILAELEKLKGDLQKNVYSKLQNMEKAARLTREVAFSTMLVLLGLGTALSLAISRSITKPRPELATEQFGTPLLSIRENVHRLAAELAEIVTAEQRTKLDILAKESDRLIGLLNQLSQSPKTEVEADRQGEGKPICPLNKTGLEVRTLGQWTDILSGLGRRAGSKTSLVVASLTSLLVGSWNSIKISLYTLRYGKAKK